jgi:hypothetical protein
VLLAEESAEPGEASDARPQVLAKNPDFLRKIQVLLLPVDRILGADQFGITMVVKDVSRALARINEYGYVIIPNQCWDGHILRVRCATYRCRSAILNAYVGIQLWV